MNVINVYLSNSKCDAVSRLQLLEWLNSHVRKRVSCIEEMACGTIYCFMLHRLFPGFVNLDQVVLAPKLEHQKRYNFRILETAFRKLGVQKQVNIDKLVLGKFQDNLEFLQWFYKFYEINSQYQLECKEKGKCVSFELREEEQIPITETEAVEKPAAQINNAETEAVPKSTIDKIMDNLANDIDQYEMDLICSASEVESKELATELYKRILTHVETLLEKQCARFHILRRSFTLLSQLSPLIAENMPNTQNFVKLQNSKVDEDEDV